MNSNPAQHLYVSSWEYFENEKEHETGKAHNYTPSLWSEKQHFSCNAAAAQPIRVEIKYHCTAATEAIGRMRQENPGEALGQVGRGGENGDIGKMPDSIIFDKMFGGGFQFAVQRMQMMNALFTTRMFHLFFKKRERACRVVVVLIVITYLLHHCLLNRWE